MHHILVVVVVVVVIVFLQLTHQFSIFDHPGSLGHINMSRQNPRHLQQKTTTTHNTQHTKINYKNK